MKNIIRAFLISISLFITGIANADDEHIYIQLLRLINNFDSQNLPDDFGVRKDIESYLLTKMHRKKIFLKFSPEEVKLFSEEPWEECSAELRHTRRNGVLCSFYTVFMNKWYHFKVLSIFIDEDGKIYKSVLGNV